MKIFCLILFVTFIISCQKAGLGGKASVRIFPQHHANAIKNYAAYPDTVLVKFKANELPGTRASDFDAVFSGNSGDEFVTVSGLKPGLYYFYASGMDSSGPYRVKGGMPFKISYKERKKNFDLILPVVE